MTNVLHDQCLNFEIDFCTVFADDLVASGAKTSAGIG